jgi:hypothetical protein
MITSCNFELELEIEGKIEKFIPAKMPSKNNETGSPAEGGEVEDFGVFLNGHEITKFLTDKQISVLQEYLIEASRE